MYTRGGGFFFDRGLIINFIYFLLPYFLFFGGGGKKGLKYNNIVLNNYSSEDKCTNQEYSRSGSCIWQEQRDTIQYGYTGYTNKGQ